MQVSQFGEGSLPGMGHKPAAEVSETKLVSMRHSDEKKRAKETSFTIGKSYAGKNERRNKNHELCSIHRFGNQINLELSFVNRSGIAQNHDFFRAGNFGVFFSETLNFLGFFSFEAVPKKI